MASRGIKPRHMWDIEHKQCLRLNVCGFCSSRPSTQRELRADSLLPTAGVHDYISMRHRRHGYLLLVAHVIWVGLPRSLKAQAKRPNQDGPYGDSFPVYQLQPTFPFWTTSHLNQPRKKNGISITLYPIYPPIYPIYIP